MVYLDDKPSPLPESEGLVHNEGNGVTNRGLEVFAARLRKVKSLPTPFRPYERSRL